VLLELTVAEQRFNAVMEVLRDGLTVTEVADRYGVSRQAVHSWLRRYTTGGLEALASRSHRPRHCPHQMPAEVEARLCELRRHHPGWGQRRLAHELARDGVDPPPGLTSIYRALVRNGLIQPRPRRRAKASYRRWERARPMELWQLDILGGIWLTDGRELKAVTGIDDHSRFCVAAGLIERATARSVCRVFTQALERYGTPEEVLTDNGKVFTGRLNPHPSEVVFDRICREHGITHRLTGVRCPTTTGKIERFHKTLRAELLTGRRFDSLTHAQQVLDDWVEDYNTQRPHQAIAMAVPAQRFRPATTGPALASRPPAPPARPATLSPTEVTRRVSASGLIGVCYQQVSAGRHLAGQIVTVRLHPTLLQVYFAGQLIRTVPRTSTKEVVQLRAHRPHRPKRPTTN
jgi:transposase InsO family protein